MKKNTYSAKFLLLNFTNTIFSKCSIRGQLPLGKIDKCLEFKAIYDSDCGVKVYTKKELIFFEDSISNFHHKYYQPEIQKCHFILPM